jgi:hypothetical protein
MHGTAAPDTTKGRAPRRAPPCIPRCVPLRALSALVLLSGILFLLPCALRGADSSEPLAEPVLPMVRAMGGAHTAVAFDQAAIFTNPAGYALVKDRIISVLTLGIRINIDDSALKLYNGFLTGTDVTSSANVDEYFSNTTLTPGLTGPFQFGRIGNNFGFAFYNNVDVRLVTRPGGILPSAVFRAHSDLGLVGGYGFKLPFIDGFYAGFNLKVLLRLKSEIDGTIIAVVDTVSDSDSIPIAKAIGFGSDLGLLYSPAPWCRLGLSAKDFFGTRFRWERLNGSGAVFSPSYIKPRIAIGAAFFPIGTAGTSRAAGAGASKGFSNLVLAADYADLLDFSPFFSNVRFGASFNTLGVITLRFGFEAGYLAGGMGFDLKAVHIDLAYFVDELGSYPGSRPAQNAMLNFALRW